MCARCKSDTTILVSTTNAKKKYMLTQDEINDAGLYYCEITCMGTPGYKYLVYDIERLAESIFADIGSNDTRKLKYLENIKDETNKMDLIDNMRENISMQLEEMEFEIDDDAEQFIEKIARIKYSGDFNDAFSIVKRYVKINNLIDMCDDEPEFIDDAKRCREMDAYIFDHSMTLCETFCKITNNIEKRTVLEVQRKKIDSFISKNIDQHFVEFVKSLSLYKSYVRKKMSNAEFRTIKERVIEHVERKEEYNNLLMASDSKYSHEIRSSPECKKYVRNLRYTCDLAVVVENIKKNVDGPSTPKKPREKKKKLRERKKRQADEAEEYYKKYEEKHGEQSERQWLVRKSIATKIDNVDNAVENLKLNNPHDYENVKFQYLMGDISFSRMNNSLREIKCKYVNAG